MQIQTEMIMTKINTNTQSEINLSSQYALLIYHKSHHSSARSVAGPAIIPISDH